VTVDASFKDDSFYPKIRRKYFTTIDWFSFVGGILGLFFGFSFLSGFEIMYHIWKGIFSTNIDQNLIVNRARNSKVKKRLQKIWKYVKIFMDNSSIHGLSYVTKSEIRIYERYGQIILNFNY